MDKDERKEYDELLFIPNCCEEEGIRGPAFPSPRSCLSGEELAKVEERIKEANRLLLNLSKHDDKGDEPNHDGLREAFAKIIGMTVCIRHREGETFDISGEVKLAGKDFVLIAEEDEKIALLYSKVEEIEAVGDFSIDTEKEERSFNPFIRRCLAYHFGETVSRRPELVHLFFGIRLNAFLQQFIGSQLRVVLGKEELEGEIDEVNQDSIQIYSKEGSQNIISIRQAKYLTIETN